MNLKQFLETCVNNTILIELYKDDDLFCSATKNDLMLKFIRLDLYKILRWQIAKNKIIIIIENYI